MKPDALLRPTFFIVGAPKCGTTSLHHYLSQHPDVCMSEPKEPRCIEFQSSGDYDAAYQNVFRHWSGEKHLGEASPTYLFVPYVAERISKWYPDVRIIAILRDPIDRAYSDWWMYYSRGIEKLSFENVVRLNLDLLAEGCRFCGVGGENKWKENVRKRKKNFGHEPVYVDVGNYGEQLARYFRYFPRDQIHVLTLDELITQTTEAMESIYRFLDINSSGIPLKLEEGQNKGLGAPPKYVLQLFRVMQSANLSRFVPKSMQNLVSRWLRHREERPRISEKVVELLRTHYRKDIQQLERLLDRKFPEWQDGYEMLSEELSPDSILRYTLDTKHNN